MEELLIALLIVSMIVNIVLLIMCFIVRKKRRCLGTLVINMTDPDKDIYRVEMDDLQDLEKEKIVFLKVRIEDNTQK